MKRQWRRGSIELNGGYALLDKDGQPAERLDDIRFAVEGGFVNVRVPGRAGTQLVSAPGVRRIQCDWEE
ncbi:MAG: hypothetical protein HOU81_12015 [Hamadaea sp.]|uniref:hypothetical protein n=1 Tax=Hamadaea sp. TaxID=2024425 RepID=UPI00185A5D68|nr:hypothetical protein [Hamadaea sp.]NUR71536.1 hypothetical protein [Hamadaea sp.]NUT19664.1 hypothetical protein [Hamadaea sp.]